MVRTFLLAIHRLRVKHTDGITQQTIQISFHLARIATLDGFPECRQLLCVTEYRIFEPLLNLEAEHLTNLMIRNHEFIVSRFRPARLRQIPGRKEHAPQILYTAIDLIIGQIQTQLLLDGLSGDQTLDLVPRGFIRLRNKTFYKIIATGIDPVCLRARIDVIQATVHMVDHFPRTVHIHVTEAIAVVPLLRLRILRFQVIIREQLPHFRIRKPKLLIETRIRNRQNLKIIQSGENALLRNTKTARQHREIQRVIRFQCFSKQRTHKRHHLPIVAMLECLIKRHIVLID